MFPKSLCRLVPALVTICAASAASAHPVAGDAVGFSHGFLHPISGLDHVLAMTAVGLFAAHLGGRALWLVPMTFVVMMAFGGALGLYGVAIPSVETGIALSVVALGAAIAFGIALPLVAAMALVGFFAIFHGHAHGAEMPLNVSTLGYGAGFLTATALLHATGVALGRVVALLPNTAMRNLLRVTGAGIGVAGVGLLFGLV